MALDDVSDVDQPSSNGSAELNKLEVVVNGQREVFDLTNPEHRAQIKERAQLGTKYSQKATALNQERAKMYADLKPYLDFDEALKADDDLRALVTARLRGDPLPLERFGVRPSHRNGADDDAGDDSRDTPDVAKTLRGEFNAKLGGFERTLSSINETLQNMSRASSVSADEQKIRSDPKLKGWLTEDHIAAAKDSMERRGGSLLANFKDLYFDDIVTIAERRVQRDLPADIRRAMLTRDEAPIVVDGVRLTEERIAEIRKDPNLYAKYKTAIRAERRRRSGKMELPR
jgi:hypothetical protein